MQFSRSSIRILIITILTLTWTGVQALEPPPLPTKLSAKERSSLIAIYESLVEDSEPLKVGDTEQELLDRLGSPDGTMTIGNKKRLSYGSGSVTVADSRLVEIRDIPQDLLTTPNREAFEDYMAATGRVYYMGEWMSYADARNRYEKGLQDQKLTRQRITMGKAAKTVRERKIAVSNLPYYAFKRQGAAITLSEVIVPGKVTVVDFYADWCGPCKAIDPYLRNLSKDDQVVVRKVDIVNWGSPVARQYGLKSIPNMRVFDKTGKQVGEPTHDVQLLYKYIRRAKRS